jgi:D-arabinose 1-dehydrogenase-like Zn-dependent alcohol dehydrogenase
VWAFTGLGGGYVEQAIAPVGEILVLPADLSSVGDRLRTLGATHVLDRAGQGGDDGPAGYDVVFDVVAGAGMPSFFGRLKPNGRMVVVGVVAGYPPADFGMTMMAAFQKSLSFATFSSDTVPSADRRAVRISQFEAAGRGELQMVVHEVLPLEQARQAHEKMDAGEVFGRIVLVPSGLRGRVLVLRPTSRVLRSAGRYTTISQVRRPQEA